MCRPSATGSLPCVHSFKKPKVTSQRNIVAVAVIPKFQVEVEVQQKIRNCSGSDVAIRYERVCVCWFAEKIMNENGIRS